MFLVPQPWPSTSSHSLHLKDLDVGSEFQAVDTKLSAATIGDASAAFLVTPPHKERDALHRPILASNDHRHAEDD
jgi:hypothetical protein